MLDSAQSSATRGSSFRSDAAAELLLGAAIVRAAAPEHSDAPVPSAAWEPPRRHDDQVVTQHSGWRSREPGQGAFGESTVVRTARGGTCAVARMLR